MTRRPILTLSTAASLYGLYAIYSLLVSPHISPPITEIPRYQTISQDQLKARSSKSQEEAGTWLKQHPWVKEAKYEFRPDKLSYVFTQEWEKVPTTGEIRLRPFAMISHRADDPPDRQPITIVSESALLRFENGEAILKLDSGVADPEGKANPGRIVGASLDGDVFVRGPDNMSVTTRNVTFSESAQRMWNDLPVAFTYRQNYGTAHGLEMDLLPSPQKTPSRDKPNIGGVRTVRLVRDVVMHLIADQKDSKEPAELHARQNNSPLDREGRKVVVTSKGRFEYVVEANVATFQNDVVVRSPTGPDEYDTLKNVDTLTLIFERRQANHGLVVSPVSLAAPVPANADDLPGEKRSSGKGDAGALEFRRLKAEGRPAMLTSQKSQLTAQMEEVIYDTGNSLISLRDPKQVHVLQRNNELSAPEIVLPLSKGGKVLSAVCRGKGSVRTYAPGVVPGSAAVGPRDLQFFAEWSKQMRRYPDPDSNLDLIELHGDAVLNQPEKMALRADLVKIWLTPEDDQEMGTRSREPGKERSNVKPKRLLALDKVAFATPQMRGETKMLRVWFEDGKLSPIPDVVEPEIPRGAPRAVPLSLFDQFESQSRFQYVVSRRESRLRQVSSKQRTARSTRSPARERGTPQTSKPETDRLGGYAAVDDPLPRSAMAPSRRDRNRNRGQAASNRRQKESVETTAFGQGKPMHVVADVISVRTLQDGSKSEVAEVVTERNVYIKQERENGAPPMEVRGNKLLLWNYIGNNQVVQVKGQPAEVRDRGLQLEGADILLDRGHNNLRVKGVGMLRLPLQSGLDGRKLDKPQFLDVWWKERMDFDGLVANFYLGVKSVFAENQVNCQEMNVKLTRRVSFSDPNPREPGRASADTSDDGTPQAEVDTVHCLDGVDIVNREYVGNRLTEIRKAKTFEMTMSQKTGDISASGPGTLQIWRRRNGNRSSNLGGPRLGGSRRPAEEEPSRDKPGLPWEYTQVDFSGAMQGNGRDRVTVFKDRVQVIHGPVESSQKVLDGDDLPREGGWMKCDSLQLAQRPPVHPQTQPTLEMLATGNAEMEGQNREFHGMADTISYDESKGMFMLRSVGNRKATIWRQTRPGAEPSRAEAQRMEFVPSRNDLKTFGTSGVEGFLGK